MRESSANILFHIRKGSRLDSFHDIEHHMANAAGVQSACVSCKHSNLMLVDYDPQETSSKSLLHRLQDRGLNAVLIGL